MHLEDIDTNHATAHKERHESLSEYMNRLGASGEEAQKQILKLEETILEGQQASDAKTTQIMQTLSGIGENMAKLESRLNEVDAASKHRDEHIISLLEQISKRQGLVPAPAPPPPAPVPAPPPPAPVPQAAPPQPPQPPQPAEPNTAIGSVGLMLGQLMEVGRRDGRPKVHLQVQGVLPGTSLCVWIIRAAEHSCVDCLQMPSVSNTLLAA